VQPVTITTDRLALRAFTDRDVDDVHLACQDADIQHFTPVPTPYHREDAARYIDKSIRDWATGADHTLAAVRAADGAFVGSFCLTRKERGLYELGYWVARPHRRRGYSYEAARALCDWGFATLDAHRLEWWAMVGNTGSRALAERLGFAVEGTLRGRTLVDGAPHDWWVGGLLRA
jgi:RimJ/RimL family protein N-acetyltransferase